VRNRGLLLVVGGALLVGSAVVVFLAQRPPLYQYPPPYVVAKAADLSGTPQPIQVVLQRGADRVLQRNGTGFPCPPVQRQMGCPASPEFRPTSVFLVRDEAGGLHALIGEDPRNGCALEWKYETMFYDVCHGSIYDRRGQRVGGPSPWNLNELALEIRDGDVYINPGRIVVGACPGCSGWDRGQDSATPKIQWTPWAPIAFVVSVTVGAALLVGRRTGSTSLGLSTALLVLALASFAFGTIATVAYFWGGALLLAAVVGFGTGIAARRERARRGPEAC
jgi:hypothetical protein